MPVYNVEKYLSECLKSICNQTYKNIEIIVIDDGSTDNSGKICDDFSKNDSRISVVHQQNKGVSYSRNVGLSLANGDYILFVDGDDFVKENMIELMENAMLDNYQYDLCVCNYNIYDKASNEQKLIKINKKDITLKDYCNQMLYGNSIEGFVWNRLYKKELLEKIKFDEDIFLLEDLVFNVKYLKEINRICYINEPLYFYRIRSNSALHKEITEKSFNSIIAKFYIIKLLEGTKFKKSIYYQKINILYENEKLKKNFELKKIKINNSKYKYINENIKKYIPLIFYPSFFLLKTRIKYLIIVLFPQKYMKRIRLNENK